MIPRQAAFYAAISLSLGLTTHGWAHGGQPQIIDIRFMPQAPDRAWAITDNQGLFVAGPAGTRWLCEDSIEPGEGVRAVGLLGPGQDRWILSTDLRLYQTTDGGCTFTPIDGPLAGQRTQAIAVHPDDPARALVGTDTLGGRPNDVYRTTDGGRTWQAAGLALPGQITAVHRAGADPRRIYLMHEGGGERSDDEGARFNRIKLGPARLNAQPAEFKILGTSPVDADILFAAIERFDTIVVRSADGGSTWDQVLEVPDFPLTLVMAQDGREALIHSPFEGLRRSQDGGQTWQPVQPHPVDRLGCLRRAPRSDRLWGCTNIFFGGPWALGISDDFGRTWRAQLGAFEAVERWDCAAGTLGRDCCQHLCPGLPPEGMCADATADPGPMCGGIEPPADMGLIDMGAPDAGAEMDTGLIDMDVLDAGADLSMPEVGVPDGSLIDTGRPDAMPDRATRDRAVSATDGAVDGAADGALNQPDAPADSGGCRQGRGSGPGSAPLGWGLLGLLGWGRVQRRRRKSTRPPRASIHTGASLS